MKIEKNILIPSMSKYPINEMEIGDSFFLENRESAPIGVYNTARRSGAKVTLRKEGNGYRVWRIA